MKNIIICILFTGVVTLAHSQPLPDSIKAKYNTARTDEEKGPWLNTYLVRASTADSKATTHALELLAWFKKQNDEVGADYAELYFADVLNFKGDYSAGLNLALPILSRFEKRKDHFGIMRANNIIDNAFLMAKNYEQAVTYTKKAVPLAQTIDAKESLSRIYNHLGAAYALALMPDSALLYSQKAVNVAMEMKDYEMLPISLSSLAESYMAANEYDIAIPFLRKSMSYYLTQKSNINNFGMAWVNNDFAQAFLALKQYDSANYYAL